MGSGDGFVPIPVADLGLDEPGPDPRPNELGQISLLVRLHGTPVGVLDQLVPDAGRASGDLRARAREELTDALAEHLRVDGLTLDDLDAGRLAGTGCARRPAATSVAATVVICTLGREPRLGAAVRSVLAQSLAPLEVLVVDNDPASGRVAVQLADVHDRRLRVVEQPRRGLSAARNAGSAAAQGDVVAFTDDDAKADPGWLEHLVAPFDLDQDVVCTTGLVLPASLTTAAQVWFEEYGAFDKGFEPTLWTLADPVPGLTGARRGHGGTLFPYAAGVYGSGNNMAFRLSWLRDQPLFDVALGAGAPTRGGEDLDAFLRVLLSGRSLYYEPAALVRHHARSDMDGLRTQMFGYGSGMAAVIVKHAVRPRGAAQILSRVPAGLVQLFHPASDKNRSRSARYPRQLARRELLGYAAGPALYARARLRGRQA